MLHNYKISELTDDALVDFAFNGVWSRRNDEWYMWKKGDYKRNYPESLKRIKFNIVS